MYLCSVKNREILISASVAVMMGVSGQALGAPAQMPAASARPDTVRSLDELSVVAIKQTEALRDDALSASVLGRSELEQLNAQAIKQISDVVPNLYIPEYGSRITSTIYVRGIGARMDQPSVGLNVDNVPFLNKNAYDFDLADIAAVEMMRGPQSTLYGRNTIGGLINITTLSPLRYSGWRAMLSGGSGNDWKASLGWYGKLTPGWGTALTASFSHLGGFHRNEYNGRKTDRETSGALRWKLEGRINRALTLRNTASASILRQGGYPYEYIATGQISHDDTCFYRRFIFNDGLTLNLRKENFTLSSITSVQYLDDNMTLDQDFLPLPYFTLTQKQKEVAVTEDIVFRGSRGGGAYEWVAGCFAFFKHIDMKAPVTFGDKGISELIEKHRNDANPDYPIAWDTRNFTLGSEFRMPTGGIALYHESTFRLGDWKLTAGLRLDWERAGLSYRSSCDTGYEIMQREPDGSLSPYRKVDIMIDDRDRLHRDFFNWMPKLTAMYALPMEGENNVYASVTKGYKSGGYNTQMFSEVLQQRLMTMMGVGTRYDVDKIVGYKPEYSWNYEIGAHLTFPAVCLSVDASAFYISCHDQQLTMFPDGTTTGRIMTNAGRTRSMGAELSARCNPWSRLWLTAGYGFTDARFREFFNGMEDYRGKVVPYAPRNTLFAEAEYEFRFASAAFIRTLSLAADMRGAGKIYWNESNSTSQGFYQLLGASVTVGGEKWSMQIWGRNLTGTRYDTFYFKSMGNEFLQRGRPRQIGATLRVEI